MSGANASPTRSASAIARSLNRGRSHQGMTITKYLLAAVLILVPLGAFAQKGLDPSLLLEPPIDAWPTYHGDYSGRHYSSLKQINSTNVKGLSLAWINRANLGPAGAIIGGEGTD